MVHLDTGFMGAVKRANLGTVEIAYRRFGPLNTTAVLQQRPLVRMPCSRAAKSAWAAWQWARMLM